MRRDRSLLALFVVILAFQVGEFSLMPRTEIAHSTPPGVLLVRSRSRSALYFEVLNKSIDSKTFNSIQS